MMRVLIFTIALIFSLLFSLCQSFSYNNHLHLPIPITTKVEGISSLYQKMTLERAAFGTDSNLRTSSTSLLLSSQGSNNDDSTNVSNYSSIMRDEEGLESLTIDQSGNDNDNDNLSEGTASSEEEEEQNERNISGEIFAIAIPAFLGLAIDPLMTLIDTAFIGRTAINADALAGVGSASGLLTFSFYLFTFLTSVTTPLVSQRRAAGNEDGAIAIGGQALSLAILLGVSLTAILVTFSQPLLQVMGVGNIGTDAGEYATTFLQIRAFAAPAVFLMSASTGILRGYLDSKSAFYIIFLANLINFTLDVVLINFLGMGPRGAAIATTTAEWVAATSFLGILAGKLPSANAQLGSNQLSRQQSSLEAPLLESSPLSQDSSSQELDLFIKVTPSFRVPSWESIKPLIVASSASFLRSVSLQLSIAGAAAMAARSGNNAAEVAAASIAAHQIALQLWLLCSFVCDALAAASQALVSDAIGRSDSDGIRKVCNAIFLYSLGLGIILATFLLLGDVCGFLLSLFTSDVATQEALKPILLIVTASQPLNAYVFAADGVIQGASEFTYEAKSMLCSASVAVGSFITLQHFGDDTLSHVWYGLVILQLMRAVTATWKMVDAKGPIDLLSLKNSSP